MNMYNIVGFGFFAVFGLFSLAAAAFMLSMARQTRRGRKVWGDIVELEEVVDGGETHVLPTVRYTGVSGRPLTRPTRAAVAPGTYQLGQRVEIMDAPGRRFAVLADQRDGYLFALFPLPIALVFFGVAWFVLTGDVEFTRSRR
ncbi:DUF3592 domain-containing protein [Jannaschia pohangensis]|uniref:DUF3592 domain-containing protein n=1 Tax=Jannaschia pohangensis TaxID=390807 RepID=A0A1I3UZD5_9RHOB|nr:DUF3592 domain-containing protein [Jannaschia pohangensis]SFJ88282.1 hypothetical protein SAMN04488095_0045 [Jannaschia pohangensis]